MKSEMQTDMETKLWKHVTWAVLVLLLAIIALGAWGCYQHEQTNRTAMEHGYIDDRGEWRKQ